MKITIKKIRYDFGQGVVRDTFFCKVWDNYGWLVDSIIGGFTKEEALQTKKNLLNDYRIR